MIKAVIFDMDGVLIDSEPLWHKTVVKIYKQVGVDITETHRNHMKGRKSLENAQSFYDQYRWEGLTPQEVSDLIIKDMVKLVKCEGRLMPGVHHALQICKQASLPVAVASSSPMVLIEAVVDKLELSEHFDHIYSAQFEPYGKPHPGVFLKVAEHFGVPPQQCLVFEDSLSGVLAAKAARMQCVAVPEPALKTNPSIQIADVVLDSLEEFDKAMLRHL